MTTQTLAFEVRPTVDSPTVVVGIGPTERAVAFLAPTLFFLVAGWNMAVTHALVQGDSLARVAQASSVVFSRDPHLEAIGFVWSPFPTLFEIPLVWFSRWFPVLVTNGMAGIIVSSILMGAMCSVVYRWSAEVGVGRVGRTLLVALLALNPMIVLYGANGMSEAGMLFFLVVAARRLALWWEDEQVLDLVAAAAACAMAYLTRYEAAASAIFLMGAVALHVWRRNPLDEFAVRVRRTATTTLIAGLPAMFAIGMWALVSWAIVGQPFAQFTSEYGNSNQVKANSAAMSGIGRAVLFVQQLALFGLVAVAALVFLTWFGTRGGSRVVAACVMLGGALAFQFASAFTGSTFSFARYAIAAVPLGALLAGPLIAALAAPGSTFRALGIVIGVALAVAALAATFVPIRQSQFGTGEEAWQLSVFPAPYRPAKFTPRESLIPFGQRIAREVERYGVRPGDVITDSANTFPVMLAAKDQRAYIITSDRDFLQAASDPAGFGVRFILVADPAGGMYDALEATHPGLYNNGAGIADLMHEWSLGGNGGLHIRMYRVIDPRPRRS